MSSSGVRVRTRFAPSPTGYLHVGGARTALYPYLFAKQNQGDFILRIEDTDLERSTDEAMRMQIQDLDWLGLNWDEGPHAKTYQDVGQYGPYRQSQRKHIYLELAEKLLAQGLAYYDFRTDAEIDALREQAIKDGRPQQTERPKILPTIEEAKTRIKNGEKGAIRFKTGEKRDYVLQDLVRGEVTFPSDMVGDFVILRSNGMPVYNFCCVIDDALMKVTHVFRAEEHLSNTLRQMMLYEAFGWELPKFGHLSIILGTDKQKLSKRHGATSCNDFRLRGYLPEALINYLALLGWSSPKGQEIMSMDEMIEQFSYDRLNASAAVFDEQKLNHFNSTHLRALSHQDLWSRLRPILQEAGMNFPLEGGAWREGCFQDRALAAFKTSMILLNDAVPLFQYVSDEKFSVKEESAEVLSWPETLKVWQVWKQLLQEFPQQNLSAEDFELMQNKVKDLAAVKGKTLFQPIRVAIIGVPHGTELKLLVPLISKASLLARVQTCLSKVGQS